MSESSLVAAGSKASGPDSLHQLAESLSGGGGSIPQRSWTEDGKGGVLHLDPSL
jgi:hypothetical protein